MIILGDFNEKILRLYVGFFDSYYHNASWNGIQ